MATTPRQTSSARPTPPTSLASDVLEGFRRSQAMAYDCAAAVEAQLREGMTERDAAQAMRAFLADHGVHHYFHMPFVWFGDRTTLGMHTGLRAKPSRRRLEPGMPVILDVAPIVDGYASDIGYACKLGDNALHDQMLTDLAPYRDLIVDGVNRGDSMRSIYQQADDLLEKQGYLNRHQRYPYKVIGHRVDYIPETKLTTRTFLGFSFSALGFLRGKALDARRGDHLSLPLWNGEDYCEMRPGPGLWALEPHMSLRGVGAKWEELLVVPEQGDAYWLDDDLPHVRRFRGEPAFPARTPQQVVA